MTTQALTYIACDVPEGMRLNVWRAARAPRRHRRRPRPVAIRPLAALDARR
jgi:hypothetical protein